MDTASSRRNQAARAAAQRNVKAVGGRSTRPFLANVSARKNPSSEIQDGRRVRLCATRLLRGRTSRLSKIASGYPGSGATQSSNTSLPRGRWLSPSRGMHPSGVTRTFFSFTVAGPRRIHTGFPISRWLFNFQNEAHPSDRASDCQGRQHDARGLAGRVHDCSRAQYGKAYAGSLVTDGVEFAPLLAESRIPGLGVESRSSWHPVCCL